MKGWNVTVANNVLDLAEVRSVEERALNAWPALQSVLSDGWLFRFSNGYTKRANSVNAMAPEGPFSDVFRHAESLYQMHQLPLIFRISPLAGGDADSHLGGLGFQRIDETLVMTTPLTKDVSADDQIVINTSLHESWSAGFAKAHEISSHHRGTHDAILSSIRLPVAYAMLVEKERPIAFGIAVIERKMIGLFDIVTDSEHRRRGIGRRLTSSLMAWGAQQGALEAYLQVTAKNDDARSVYEKLGFQEKYRYHYRMRA